jgi:hypothetical protein
MVDAIPVELILRTGIKIPCIENVMPLACKIKTAPNRWDSVVFCDPIHYVLYFFLHVLKGNIAKKIILYMFFLMYKYGCLYVY